MNLDDTVSQAAARLHEWARVRADTAVRLEELHGHGSGQRRRRVLATALTTFAVVVIAALVVAGLALVDGGDDAAGPSTSLRESYGVVATWLPSGMHPTEYLDTQPNSDSSRSSGSACCASRTFVFSRGVRHAKPVDPVSILVTRNPLNGVLADQDPATVSEQTGTPIRLRWTRAPDWEFQLQSDLPRAQLSTVASALVVPTDSAATVRDVVVGALPAGYRTVADEFDPVDESSVQEVTYAGSYGAAPSLTVSVSSGGVRILEPRTLQLIRVDGHKAYFTADRNGARTLITRVQWHTPRGTISVAGVGLSRPQLLKAAASVRGLDKRRWMQAHHGARLAGFPDAGSPAFEQFLRGDAPPIDTYQRPEGTYTLRVGSFDDAGTRWLCISLNQAPGNANVECTDPATGFATPTRTLAFGKPDVIAISFDPQTISADMRLANGQTLPMKLHDTHTGSAPHLFYTILDFNHPAGTIIGRDACGRTTHTAKFAG